MFIVLEGPDGSGTTLHSGFLAENLRNKGEKVLLTAEPTDGPIGKHVRSILDGDSLPSPDAVQLLFCADRAQHVESLLQPAIDEGATIVCDRYSLSTIVYGAATGIDKQWLKQVNNAFPKPDLLFVLLPPFDVCMERIGRRNVNDQFEKQSLQRRVYDEYKNVEDPTVIFIDSSKSKSAVAQEILDHALRQKELIAAA